MPGSNVYKDKLIDLVKSHIQGFGTILISDAHMKSWAFVKPLSWPISSSHISYLTLPSLSSQSPKPNWTLCV